MKETDKRHLFRMNTGPAARGWRRRIAALLTVCMVATLMPQAAFAVGTGGAGQESAQKSPGGGINGSNGSAGQGSGAGAASGSDADRKGTATGNNADQKGTATDSNADGDEQADTTVITSFEELNRSVYHQEIPKGAKETDIYLPKNLLASGFVVTAATPSDAMLDPDYIPDEGEVTVKDSLTIGDVDWELTGKNGSPTSYEEGREKNCAYYYRPVLPEGYEVVRDVNLPEIEVWYGFGNRNASDFEGSGTEEVPWKIKTYGDLAKLAQKVNSGESYEGKFFKLEENFSDVHGEVETPIGGAVDGKNREFQGTFDGSGETVNLNISDTKANHVGLFGMVGSSGTVKNVIVSGNVTGGFNTAGGVAGANKGTIKNCGNTCTVESGGIAGGIAGDSTSYIKECWNSGDVQGDRAGGIAGVSRAGAGIDDCWNSGTVQGRDIAGGIVSDNANVLNCCYNVGKVISSDGDAGGIAAMDNGGITYSVSLGVTVISGSSSGNSGRIVPSDGATLYKNKARADMLIGPADFLATPSDADTMTADGINGEDVNVGVDSLAAVFSGFSSSTWNIPGEGQKLEVGCELPTLKGDTDNPAVQPTTKPKLPKPVTPSSQIVPTREAGSIFANGAALILKAGKTSNKPDDMKTVIYVDKNRDGVVNGTDWIWDPDGATGIVYNGTDAGNDLGTWTIYGGSYNASIPGGTKITMEGGNVGGLCGGGLADTADANVGGDTDITVINGNCMHIYGGGVSEASGLTADIAGDTSVKASGGSIDTVQGGGVAAEESAHASVGKTSTVEIAGQTKVMWVYGGGYAFRANSEAYVKGSAVVRVKDQAQVGNLYLGGVADPDAAGSNIKVGQGSTLTVGAGVQISRVNEGIRLNGGTGTSSVTNGVNSFAIDPNLTGTEPVHVVIPGGFVISGNPVIATGAVQEDLNHIKLTGAGAELLETYWEDDKIKLRKGFAGKGTAEEPWQIKTYEDLETLAQNVNSGESYEGEFFKMDDSFNTEADAVRTSIGTPQNPFDGTFDGNGKTVRLEINKRGAIYQGLFGSVDTNGIIRNVIVSGEVTGGNNTGGVAGFLRGTVENCGSTAMVTGASYTGGVVGFLAGMGGVKNCYSTGTVNGESKVGGIVGSVELGTVEYCYNVGDVKANGRNIGGIYGDGRSSAKVKYCVSLGLTVTGGSADSTGRITGVTSGTFDGNKARSDMKIGVEGSLGIPNSGIGADQMNGANIDADGTVLLTDVFTDGDWSDPGIWNIPGGGQKLKADCELPTLVTCRGAQTPKLPGTVTQPVPTLEGGSIFANGAALILKEGKTNGKPDHTKTVIYVDKNRNKQIDGNETPWDPDGITGMEYNGTETGNDLGTMTIYGGKYRESLEGDTQITMLGGNVFSIRGGGLYASLTGDTDITIKGGSVLSCYGGGFEGDVNGSTRIEISGGSVTVCYGGGFALANDVANVSKDTSVLMSGGKSGTIYGGGYADKGIASVGQSSSVILSGSAEADVIYGGGYREGDSDNADVNGAVSVELKDSASAGKVYLGGAFSESATTPPSIGSGSGLTVGGKVSVGVAGVDGGIRLNGGTGTSAVTNGVDSFVIDPNLTGTANVYVVVPGGFDASTNPVIATGAVQADLNHLKLTGAGAEGLAFWLDGDSIRIGETQAYTVTVDGNGGTGSTGSGRYAPGQSVTIQAGTRSGHRFNGWTIVAGALRLTDSTKANTTFIMPAGDVTVRAEWVKTDSSGGDDHGDHGNDGGGGTTGGDTTGGGSTGGTTGGATSGTGEGGTATTTPPITTQTGDGGSVSTTTTTNPATGTTVTTEVKKDAAGNVISAEAKVQTTQSALTTGENGMTIVVRVDGAAVNAAAQAARSAQGADGRQVQVNVELPADAMTTQLRTADGRPLAVEVEIPSDLAVTTGGPGTSGGAAAQVTGIRLQKEVIEAAKAAGKDVTVTVRDERGNVYYQWIFTAEDMRNSGIPAADVNLSVRIIPVKRLTGEKQSIKDAVAAGSGTSGAEAPGLYIGFDHNGILPATARVRIPAGNDAGIRPGDTVYLCWRDPATGQLVNAPENQYTVDENGFVAVRLDRAYEYVLVPVPAAGAAQTPRPSGHAVHVIQKGDTLNKLARRYGCTVADLLAANQIANVYDLRIGQEIMIP